MSTLSKAVGAGAGALDRAAAGEREHADDQRVVAGCLRGDRQAMTELYETYQRRVFSLVMRMVGSADAEELCQDVFVRIFRGLPKFRGDAALGTWIYRLAMNVCLSFLAKRTRRGQLDSRMAQPPEPTQPRVGNPWLRDQLESALAELPAGYRAVLILHDVEGLNHQEIAEIIGCRVGTSKSQLHKARMRMRKLLGPHLEADRAGSVEALREKSEASA